MSDGNHAVPGPLVAQADRTLLLEVDHPGADACRAAIAPFTELERSPEHIHTYRITELGLWNARAGGLTAESVTEALVAHSRFPVTHALLAYVADTMGRFGRVVLDDDARHGLVLRADDAELLADIAADDRVAQALGPAIDDTTVVVRAEERGRLKQTLMTLGWPADDRAAYTAGAPFEINLDPALELREYQEHAVANAVAAGSGVVVLPCGAGKTVVGIAALARLQTRCLILVTNQQSALQWREELLRWTDLTPDDIAEYSGRTKQVGPVTIATYSILTARHRKRAQPPSEPDAAAPDAIGLTAEEAMASQYRHLGLLDAEDWGLILYDEVHLLPSPVFRVTADLQSRRRVGLTATLIREDGRAGDVFSLIGPKRFDAPWRELELQGWIATAACTEVRLHLTEEERLAYGATSADRRPTVAAASGERASVVRAILEQHPDDSALIIGTYLEPLEALAAELDLPVLTGSTKQTRREQLFEALRAGEVRALVVSKVANFSVDLPEVSVAIQVSGTFGSRQEEAQRLGRVLRPKADGRSAHFYTLVGRDTIEQEYAPKRRRFLTEQGYAYEIVDDSALFS